MIYHTAVAAIGRNRAPGLAAVLTAWPDPYNHERSDLPSTPSRGSAANLRDQLHYCPSHGLVEIMPSCLIHPYPRVSSVGFRARAR